MIAKSLQELQLFQRSRQFVQAVTAILEAAPFREDRDLRDQIRDAAHSVVANIAEGFPQPTDRAFAKYLYIARGSVAEVRARLQLAESRGYLSATQRRQPDALGDEVARMATGLIKYLLRSNRRDRGLGLRRTLG